MRIKLAPVFLGLLQHQAGHAGDVVAGVLEHVMEMQAKDCRRLWQHDPEFGEQTTDTIDTGGAILLERFAQTAYAQHALLIERLGRHEVHVRSRGGFADSGGIVGVVLACLALYPVGRDELCRHHAGIQTEFDQLAQKG